MIESVYKKAVNLKNFQGSIKLFELNDIIINPEYRDMLNQLNFTQFNTVWHYQDGDTFKKIRDRSVTRIDFNYYGISKRFYLKRHNPEKLNIGHRFFPDVFRKCLSQGLGELNNIMDFRNHGLATVVPVAAGEKKINRSQRVSFLITEDFSPFVSLEWILFNQPEFLIGPTGEIRKKHLMESIGQFARRMHDAGLIHKDFNATHILLYFAGPSMEKPEMALFDLQRVGYKNLLRFRWIIKSLAEINYTLPEQYFSEKNRLQLFNAYKGFQGQDYFSRFQQWWIRQKTLRISRHTQSIINRRRSLKC